MVVVMVGGSRETTPSHPLRWMAGTKRERPSQRRQSGGIPRATRWDPGGGGSGELSPPPPPDTHTFLFPLCPLPEQLSFTRPKTPGPARSEAPKPQVRWLPGSRQRICAELEARVASTAPPAPSPLTHSPHPPRPAAFPADAPPDFGAQKAGGETRGRCGCRGSKGALRTAGERDRGFRAHLAGQLFAPVDPRPCEGFDPRHNPMGGGEPRRTRRGPWRPAVLGGGRGRGPTRTRRSWGQEV